MMAALLTTGWLTGAWAVGEAAFQPLEQTVREVLSYVSDMRPDDSLVQVEEGVWVKKSNVHGVRIGSETFYYSLAPHMSYDPLSRGDVGEGEIRVVFSDGQLDPPVIIYTILKN